MKVGDGSSSVCRRPLNTCLMKLLEKKALWALSAQQVFEVGHKKAEMRKMRSASSLLISSPAISCFLADASTKSGKSDQHFQAAAAASP